MLIELYKERGLIPVWDEDIVWEERRAQILMLLQKEEYGFFPEECDNVSFEVIEENDNFCAGKVNFKHVKVTACWEERAFSFPIYASIPKTSGKHPFFVHINFRNFVPDMYLPIEEICDCGFAVISFCYQDVTIDDKDLYVLGRNNDMDLQEFLFENREKKPDDCGKIALWA